jgi:hypothetical protein
VLVGTGLPIQDSAQQRPAADSLGSGELAGLSAVMVKSSWPEVTVLMFCLTEEG